MPRLPRLTPWKSAPHSHQRSLVGGCDAREAHAVGALDRLDLDHVGAHRREVVGDERPGPEGGEVDDAQAGERHGRRCGGAIRCAAARRRAIATCRRSPSGEPRRRVLAEPRRRRQRPQRPPPTADTAAAAARSSRRDAARRRRGRRSDRSAAPSRRCRSRATGMRSAAARSTISATVCCARPGVDHARSPRRRAARARPSCASSASSTRSGRSISTRKSRHCWPVMVQKPT